MKAVIWTRYGPPDVLQLQEVEKPTPEDDEVLIKVRAASINAWDWELMNGRGQLTLGGRLRPRYRILGCDVAGQVEEVGRNVKRFKPGDEVFGDISGSGWGGFAEYVSASERTLALKSPKMSYEQAAAIPQAATLALQALRKGNIKAGQRVLINGAGGGVGTFAVQIAKALGAEITGVDSAEKKNMVLSVGADLFIDHTQEDFTRSGREYDLIVDVVASRSVFDYKRTLAPGGRCVLVGGSSGAVLKAILLGSWILGGRKVKLLLLRPNPSDLGYLNELFEAGKVVPVIDKMYPLGEVADSFRYYEKGVVRGKIVIAVQRSARPSVLPIRDGQPLSPR
jgi:NADPH:quinone reductase-like Zn-dependent oxidoreductase